MFAFTPLPQTEAERDLEAESARAATRTREDLTGLALERPPESPGGAPPPGQVPPSHGTIPRN